MGSASAMRRAVRLIVAASVLALAGCASAPPQKARKAPATKTQTAKPASRPAAKPAAKPATKPAAKPAAKPTTQGTSTRPAAKPAPAPARPTGSPSKSPAGAGTSGTTAAPATPAPLPPPVDAVTAAKALSPRARYAKAVEMLKTNQLQDAEAVLKISAAEYAREPGPQINLGILYARSNRKPEARAAFARAVALAPRNAVAQNWAGVLAREAGDHARAEQAYRAATSADPKYAPAWLNLGLLYDQHLKRPADALAAWRQYDALTDHKDLRVAAWIAELEANGVTAPAPAPAPVPAPVSRPGAPRQ